MCFYLLTTTPFMIQVWRQAPPGLPSKVALPCRKQTQEGDSSPSSSLTDSDRLTTFISTHARKGSHDNMTCRSNKVHSPALNIVTSLKRKAPSLPEDTEGWKTERKRPIRLTRRPRQITPTLLKAKSKQSPPKAKGTSERRAALLKQDALAGKKPLRPGNSLLIASRSSCTSSNNCCSYRYIRPYQQLFCFGSTLAMVGSCGKSPGLAESDSLLLVLVAESYVTKHCNILQSFLESSDPLILGLHLLLSCPRYKSWSNTLLTAAVQFLYLWSLIVAAKAAEQQSLKNDEARVRLGI